MARRGQKEAELAADNLADALNDLEAKAKASGAGDNSDGETNLAALIRDKINKVAAEALREPYDAAKECAYEAPTVGDQGEGNGQLSPYFLTRMTERGFPSVGPATGENYTVRIKVDGEDVDSLDVNLLKPPPDQSQW